nr:Oar protein [uncultured bacterium]
MGVDPSYNYQTSNSNTYPRREEIYRGDYNISDKWKAYARYIRTKDETSMAYGQWNASYNIPFGPMSFGAPGWSFVSNVTTIINPTLTNEFVFGSSRNDLHITPITDAFNASKVGVSYKMPFPDADKLHLVQNWNFGGVPNGPTTGFAGTPFLNFNHTYDITDSVAKVHDTHTFKAGIYLHKSLKDQTAFTSVNGIINFDRDANNPNDSNWAFSNALLGNYATLQQSNQVLNGQYRSWNVEWYVQDNWRATQKLTLEYGIRFYWVQPQYDKALQTSAWNPALYDKASAAVLRTAALDSKGNRIAVNPITGETGPAALIGSIVNTGKGFVNGVYANGMGQAGKSYPKGLMNDRGIMYAPRVGIAYQISTKTVVRAGGGVFYDRLQGNPVFDMLPNPPSTIIPKFYYGNLSSIPPASAGTFFPAGVVGFDEAGHIPTTYNWNITIQRELPYSLLLDVGYVGSSSNHNLYRVNQNAIPLGAAWLPQNQDPLNTSPKFDGTTSNQPNFYRPYLGYTNTTDYGFGANSNYNSLQVAAHRRFGRSFTFDVAYTWSKVMGTANDDGVNVHPFNSRVADYGPLFYDHTHVLVFNYVYNLPQFVKSKTAFGKVGGAVANGWQVSGITTMMTGQPDNLSFSISGIGNLNERYTGSPDIAPRILINSPPSYPKGIYQWMNPTGLAVPAVKGSQGFDSAPRSIRRPGDHDWDISIFKNFPIHREGMSLQLRVEMFNAFNQVRFNDFNRSAQFNSAGQLINTPTVLGGTGGRFGFGALTGTATRAASSSPPSSTSSWQGKRRAGWPSRTK